MNVSSSLFSAHVVVLVLVTGIPDVSLLVTGTLVPFTTTSFHVTFELSYLPYRLLTDYFQSFSSVLTCCNFQHAPLLGRIRCYHSKSVLLWQC